MKRKQNLSITSEIKELIKTRRKSESQEDWQAFVNLQREMKLSIRQEERDDG